MSLTGYVFGLYDVKIAEWLGDGSYGTAVDVVSAEMAGVEFDTVTGELRGDDEITDIHARVIAANIRLKFAFNNLTVWGILSGEDVVDSTPDSQSMVFDNTNRPYFSMAARIDQTALGGDAHIFVPKCKITGPMSFAAQFGQYISPEMQARAIRENSVFKIGKIIIHNVAQGVTIPIT